MHSRLADCAPAKGATRIGHSQGDGLQPRTLAGARALPRRRRAAGGQQLGREPDPAVASGATTGCSPARSRAGKRAAAIMSLVHSAKLNGHDPYAYLKDVMQRLDAAGQPHRRAAAASLDAGGLTLYPDRQVAVNMFSLAAYDSTPRSSGAPTSSASSPTTRRSRGWSAP